MTEHYDPRLDRYLTQFLTTSLAGKRKLLVEHADVLLSKEAEQLLTERANQARRAGNTSLQAYETHLRLLADCRKHGVNSAFEAMERPQAPVLDQPVQVLAKKAAALMQQGPGGKNLAELREAIALIRKMLSVVLQMRVPPQAIVEVRHSLGNYLDELGKLSGQYVYYIEGVQEFNSCLDLISAKTAELDRAKCQVSAGQAYWQLGRLTGDHNSLNMSVANLREAKKTLERLGANELITAVGSLANTLTTLGELVKSQEMLKEAIELHRLAGDSVSRSTRPLEWALHKANLANTCRTYGQEFNLSYAFDDGLAACNASLEVRRKSQVPALWADSESIRGALLLNRGSLNGSRSDLEGALEAFAAATEVHSRDQNPRVWSDIYHNRGRALNDLGEITGQVSFFEAAIEAYQTALLERTRDHRPADWAMTANSLAIAFRKLGTSTGRRDYLEKAAALSREIADMKDRARKASATP